MTSTYQSFSPNCSAFVPSGINQYPAQQNAQNATYSPQASAFVPQYPAINMERMESFGDYSNHALKAPVNRPQPFMQKVNSAAPQTNQRFYANAPSFTPQHQMPKINVDFSAQQNQKAVFQRQPTFNQQNGNQNTFYPDFASTLG